MKRLLKLLTAASVAIAAIFALKGDFAEFLRWIFPLDYKLEISAAAAEYKLDLNLIAAVIKAESGFDSGASSGVAYGLMQLTDDTAHFMAQRSGLDYEKRLSVRTNIRMGCGYLTYLIEKFKSTETALAAYNAGPANVERWLENKKYSDDGITLKHIPFAETRTYVRRIKLYYRVYKSLYG